jgi:hypothetical protein
MVTEVPDPEHTLGSPREHFGNLASIVIVGEHLDHGYVAIL